jgi:hypothetical protein
MWEPRPITTLRAFTACYRDSFTFYLYIPDIRVSHVEKHWHEVTVELKELLRFEEVTRTYLEYDISLSFLLCIVTANFNNETACSLLQYK